MSSSPSHSQTSPKNLNYGFHLVLIGFFTCFFDALVKLSSDVSGNISNMIRRRVNYYWNGRSPLISSQQLMIMLEDKNLKSSPVTETFVGMRSFDCKSEKPFLVVVGGSFAGISVCQNVSSTSLFHLLLIEPKDYFEYTPSILRTLVERGDESTVRTIIRPFPQYMSFHTARAVLVDVMEVSQMQQLSKPSKLSKLSKESPFSSTIPSSQPSCVSVLKLQLVTPLGAIASDQDSFESCFHHFQRILATISPFLAKRLSRSHPFGLCSSSKEPESSLKPSFKRSFQSNWYVYLVCDTVVVATGSRYCTPVKAPFFTTKLASHTTSMSTNGNASGNGNGKDHEKGDETRDENQQSISSYPFSLETRALTIRDFSDQLCSILPTVSTTVERNFSKHNPNLDQNLKAKVHTTMLNKRNSVNTVLPIVDVDVDVGSNVSRKDIIPNHPTVHIIGGGLVAIELAAEISSFHPSIPVSLYCKDRVILDKFHTSLRLACETFLSNATNVSVHTSVSKTVIDGLLSIYKQHHHNQSQEQGQGKNPLGKFKVAPNDIIIPCIGVEPCSIPISFVEYTAPLPEFTQRDQSIVIVAENENENENDTFTTSLSGQDTTGSKSQSQSLSTIEEIYDGTSFLNISGFFQVRKQTKKCQAKSLLSTKNTIERRRSHCTTDDLNDPDHSPTFSTIYALGDVSKHESGLIKMAYIAEVEGHALANILIQNQLQVENHVENTPKSSILLHNIDNICNNDNHNHNHNNNSNYIYPNISFGKCQPPLLCTVSLGPSSGVLIFNDLIISGFLSVIVKKFIEYTKIGAIEENMICEFIWCLGDPFVTCINQIYRFISSPSIYLSGSNDSNNSQKDKNI